MTNGESGPGAYRPRYGPVDGPLHGEYVADDDEFPPVATRPLAFGATTDDARRSYPATASTGSSTAAGATTASTAVAGRAPLLRRLWRVTPTLGVLALVFAASTVVLLSSGIGLALDGQYAASTAVAFVGIATSILGFLLGGIALITGRGRWTGAVAMVVSVLANPVVLTHLLSWVSGLAGL